jgi:hypothetical protein
MREKMSPEKEIADNKTSGRKIGRIEILISILALAVSMVSLWISIFGAPGVVRPLTPSGYAIIREIGPFPSDHILIPLEWENTTGRPVLIRQPYLRLRELDSAGRETGKEYRFVLAGEYPGISTNSLQGMYSILNSFNLPEHAISLKLLVFHNDQWWNESSDLYRLRFKAGQEYKVYIGYKLGLDQPPEAALFDMPIYRRADALDRAKGDWWDFWYLGQ